MSTTTRFSLDALFAERAEGERFLSCARTIDAATRDPSAEVRHAIAAAVSSALAWRGPGGAKLLAALRVLGDLVLHGWTLRVEEDGVTLTRPARPQRLQSDAQMMEEKARVRAQLAVERDRQLRQGAAREFVESMERRRLFDEAFMSIYSLMRDGRELAAQLRALYAATARPEERQRGLGELIQPYLQVVEEDARCEHTGLMLRDAWRYFRHTWTSAYRSTPGRGMQLLIRDAAAPRHPVIGIAALSSPAVQIKPRDLWIGWQPECFGEEPLEDGAHRWALSDQQARWLQRVVDGAIDELYKDDLIEEQALTLQALREPDEASLRSLRDYGRAQRELHARNADARQIKLNTPPDERAPEAWVALARTPLYKSKRALTLARMLEARAALRQSWGARPTREGLEALLSTSTGRKLFGKALRKAKADRVGIAVADINVCGAVAPYSHLLGGKLVSMLLTSPEVTAAYRARYDGAPSIIASSMAGSRVERPAELVLLGTTSLYGASSQYNRLKMPCDEVGGRRGESIRYVELGESVGYGTDQFSPATVDALEDLVTQGGKEKRINSLFGEGGSPRLRKIRGGLDALGLNADALLRHGSSRAVYGIPVARNFREYLLGVDDEPDYTLPQDAPAQTTQAIVAWWRRRWLLRRAAREDVLARVASHTLIYPICHGARVRLPELDTPQLSLFDGWR